MTKHCETPCCDAATSASDKAEAGRAPGAGEWVSLYAVPRMDCPSEERMIRLALNGLEQIHTLAFDLSARQLQVTHDGPAEPITAKLQTLA